MQGEKCEEDEGQDDVQAGENQIGSAVVVAVQGVEVGHVAA